MAITKRAVAPAAVKDEPKTDVVKINPPVEATVSGAEVSAKKAEAKTAVKKAAPAKKAEAKPAEKKTAAVKKTEAKPAAKKAAPAKKAAEKAVNAELTVQYSGREYSTDEIRKAFEGVWTYDMGKKLADVKSVDLYFKPEESAVYYVVNGDETGSFNI